MDIVLFSIMVIMSVLQSTIEIEMLLNGDRFAKPHDRIHLNCSSDTVPVGMAASLQVNGVSYSTTRLIHGKCYSTDFGSKCSADICACSKKGLWYSHIYEIVQKEGSIITISCTMHFKRQSLSDSIQVKIVERTDWEWTEWTNWTVCSVLCGGGSQNRSRSYQNPVTDHLWGELFNSIVESNECNPHKCQDPTSSFDYRYVIIGITAIGIFLLTAACSAIISRGRHGINTIHIVGPNERSLQIPVYHSAPESDSIHHIYEEINREYVEVVDDDSQYAQSEKSNDYNEISQHEYEEINHV